MVSDDAGHGIYLEFDEIGSAADMPIVQPAAKPTVVAAVGPADVPDKAREGIFNLILSEANAETSLLARLCNAIYNCEVG